MINGIGGVFIFSNNPQQLAEWYQKIFKLNFESFGGGETNFTVFWSKDDNLPKRRLDTTFAIMKAKKPIAEKVNNDDKTDIYGDRSFMLNLRVENMQQTLIRLERNNLEILSKSDESYGLFAWIFDLDGNRIELYQPVREDY